MLCLIHSDSVYPFVVHCTMSERKFKIALYVKYKTWQCNLSCLWLLQSWLLYLKLNRTIAKDCHIGIITFLIRPAYRLVEPWNSLPWESLSHGLPHIPFFLYHECSSFCDFFVVLRWQNCQKWRAWSSRILHFEFVIHTYHIYDQRLVNFGKTEMLIISNFDILQ